MSLVQQEGAPRYDDVGSGFRTGQVAATALTSSPKSVAMVLIKAEAANSGKVYVGGSSVTKGFSADSDTDGMELSAGEMTP